MTLKTDEAALETDAQKALAAINVEKAKLDEVAVTDEQKAVGWIKTHLAWIVGPIGLLLGFIAGRVTH